MQFVFTKTFIKQCKNFEHQKQRVLFIATVIEDFQNNIFQSKYYRKKLQWYDDIHELEVWGDIRIIIQVIIKDDICYFLAIWWHSTLWLSGRNKKI